MPMSSRKLFALVLAVSAVLLSPATAHAAADPQLRVLAVRSIADHQVSLVYQLQPTPLVAPPQGAVTVTSGGTTRPATANATLSDRTAIGFIIDTSADAAASLQGGGLSGMASFLLQLPAQASTTVIADRRPPAVIAPNSIGVADALRATSALRGGGTRATSDAVTLALRKLPSTPGTQQVIVLYTSASNAGGESAAELGDRLRRANVILAVVDTSPDPGYWSGVAKSTGGFAIRSAPEQAIGAFDSVADGLRSRYTVTFARSAVTAGKVDVRVDTGPRVLTTAVAVPPEPVAPGTGDTGRSWFWLLAAGLLAVVVAVGIVLWERRARPESSTAPPPEVLQEPALPGVRVFDVADPAGPREITNSLFEPRIEREARARQEAGSPPDVPPSA
jgi:hypothetical protein